ncbi:hypothetical protein IV397_11145 [Enterococcus faecium]|uniref:hypothetical protein n=1 Tax=Enterococcus faecium TaxID=1352 RepID=UPI00161E3BF5|nr:hypothetical protein [Enterococcus faecium]MCD5100456.1 hypothetical protein [Enterococcus faecium]
MTEQHHPKAEPLVDWRLLNSLEQKLREISQAAKTIGISGFFPVVPIISHAPLGFTKSLSFIFSILF